MLPEGVSIRAAATASPVAFSGWDVARNGPEKTRFAVPAGAVYFVDGTFTPSHDSFCGGADDVAMGWGLTLRGTWK
jgi:CRISPR-associated protein Cmr3